MTNSDNRRIGSFYSRDTVMAASPARLLTMLYDRLLIDLGRAELAQGREYWDVAEVNLLHAQDIVSELASTLKVDEWEGGHALFALYTYVANTLIQANIRRDIDKTREAIRLLEPLRQAWHQAADSEATLVGAPRLSDVG